MARGIAVAVFAMAIGAAGCGVQGPKVNLGPVDPATLPAGSTKMVGSDGTTLFAGSLPGMKQPDGSTVSTGSFYLDPMAIGSEVFRFIMSFVPTAPAAPPASAPAAGS